MVENKSNATDESVVGSLTAGVSARIAPASVAIVLMFHPDRQVAIRAAAVVVPATSRKPSAIG